MKRHNLKVRNSWVPTYNKYQRNKKKGGLLLTVEHQRQTDKHKECTELENQYFASIIAKTGSGKKIINRC